MNKEIIAAVERLFSACIHLNESSPHSAHINFSGHVETLAVSVDPAGTVYADTSYSPILSEYIYLKPSPLETEAQILTSLNALTDRLYGMAEHEEAA
ncbi:MAG: hypothetical protein CMK99_13455 [Pseudomonas sp.]|jgi:hypothetical protein|nr:hypothetical protein [Pseudomonas sp.]HBS81046.1 hypothetical protein [Pseudomonas sp.]|tara:strand:+ start:10024 stop:10314 length:291 start_codon:yes stop_codon:yes gene_type:complete